MSWKSKLFSSSAVILLSLGFSIPAHAADFEPIEEPGNTSSITHTAPQKGVVMYRLYSPAGEHFYTSDVNERNALLLAGWENEGVGWIAPEKSNTPVYRLYNKNAPSGDHHYTTDKTERSYLIQIGWKDEGIGWYSDDVKSVPLYRQYNPNANVGTHNYTTDLREHEELTRIGWNDEGIGWYALEKGNPNGVQDNTNNNQGTYKWLCYRCNAECPTKAEQIKHTFQHIKHGEVSGTGFRLVFVKN